MAVFTSRQIVIPPITVTITGSGNRSKCYATINGTNQYNAGTHEVNAGDTITFGVYGQSEKNYSSVTIDGTQVLKVTNGSVQTYDWKVPSSISAIEISMSVKPANCAITVTTA